MVYVYMLVVILIIGYVFFRIIKREMTPSNHYTPYDGITSGKKIEVKQSIQMDSKQMEDNKLL